MTNLEIRADGRSVTVNVDAGGTVTIGDDRFSVESIAAGLYRVNDGSRQWTVGVAGPTEDRWIFLDGDVYQVEVGSAGSRSRARASGHELSSPMPATVVRILVEPGARVSRGDALLTLEAMKMELVIRAPRDGVVGAVHCKAGDLVPPGVNLLDLT